MSLKIALLHEQPIYLDSCCELLNSEWPRSKTARLRSFNGSCKTLPANILLLDDTKLIGHLKLSPIPSISNGCFIESVVIQKELRGKGYGSHIMLLSENYCKNTLKLDVIYLSTKGQEKFYEKLGYRECEPISIYGCPNIKLYTSEKNIINSLAPPPPPQPKNVNSFNKVKTYMMKIL